jgi:hypothetical protein
VEHCHISLKDYKYHEVDNVVCSSSETYNNDHSPIRLLATSERMFSGLNDARTQHAYHYLTEEEHPIDGC